MGYDVIFCARLLLPPEGEHAGWPSSLSRLPPEFTERDFVPHNGSSPNNKITSILIVERQVRYGRTIELSMFLDFSVSGLGQLQGNLRAKSQ